MLTEEKLLNSHHPRRGSPCLAHRRSLCVVTRRLPDVSVIVPTCRHRFGNDTYPCASDWLCLFIASDDRLNEYDPHGGHLPCPARYGKAVPLSTRCSFIANCSPAPLIRQDTETHASICIRRALHSRRSSQGDLHAETWVGA